jgi:hypothetical protein
MTFTRILCSIVKVLEKLILEVDFNLSSSEHSGERSTLIEYLEMFSPSNGAGGSCVE